jgi:hypothetical protein
VRKRLVRSSLRSLYFGSLVVVAFHPTDDLRTPSPPWPLTSPRFAPSPSRERAGEGALCSRDVLDSPTSPIELPMAIA